MPSSFLQELDGVLQEPIRILELRAVPGIGIDQQLGVRDVLCQVPGVDRGDHDVVHAVQDQRRVSDRAQVGIGVVTGQRYQIGRIRFSLSLGDCG